MAPPKCDDEKLLQNDSVETTSLEGNCCSRLQRWFLVEPILILYILGLYPILSISQKYVLQRITNESLHILDNQNISYYQTNTTFDPCHSNKSDPIYQFQEYVQSKSSQFLLYQSIINGIPAIFFTIILGAGSDLFGRRFAILPPLVGALISDAIITSVIYTESSIYWLFLSDALNGCCGSFYALLMGCLAYVVDRTPPERRMMRITFVELTMLIPAVISPIVLGQVAVTFGFLAPLLFIAAASIVNLLYVLIFMPRESKRKKEGISTAEPTIEYPPSTEQSPFFAIPSLLWTQICSMVTLFTKKSTITPEAVRWGRLKLGLLIAAFFVIKIPAFDNPTLFMMNSPLCWDLDMIGLFSGVSFAIASVGAMIAAPLFKYCGIPDHVIAILAGVACTATNTYKVFVKTTVMMFLTLCLSMIGVLLDPSLRSMMSNQVNDDQQGVIFGAIACVEVTCDLLGTVVFNSVYSATLFIATGFVFFVMAAFYAIGSAIVCVYAVLIKLDTRRGCTLHIQTNGPLVDDSESEPVDA